MKVIFLIEILNYISIFTSHKANRKNWDQGEIEISDYCKTGTWHSSLWSSFQLKGHFVIMDNPISFRSIPIKMNQN